MYLIFMGEYENSMSSVVIIIITNKNLQSMITHCHCKCFNR